MEKLRDTSLKLLINGIGKGERRSGGGCIGDGGSSFVGEQVFILLHLYGVLELLMFRLGFLCE